jgi:hypothetical protein
MTSLPKDWFSVHFTRQAISASVVQPLAVVAVTVRAMVLEMVQEL